MPLAGLALVAACSRRPDDVGRAAVTSIVIAVDAAPPSPALAAEDDESLAHDLRAALEADDTLSPRARSIDVAVRGRRVVLRGQVANAREHDDVIAKARRLGAESIADEMTVSATRTRASPGARGP